MLAVQFDKDLKVAIFLISSKPQKAYRYKNVKVLELFKRKNKEIGLTEVPKWQKIKC